MKPTDGAHTWGCPPSWGLRASCFSLQMLHIYISFRAQCLPSVPGMPGMSGLQGQPVPALCPPPGSPLTALRPWISIASPWSYPSPGAKPPLRVGKRTGGKTPLIPSNSTQPWRPAPHLPLHWRAPTPPSPKLLYSCLASGKEGLFGDTK